MCRGGKERGAGGVAKVGVDGHVLMRVWLMVLPREQVPIHGIGIEIVEYDGTVKVRSYPRVGVQIVQIVQMAQMAQVI